SCGEPGWPKKRPLATALEEAPPRLVTRMRTWPVRFHTRYSPPLKELTVDVYKTSLLVSRTSTRSDRPPLRLSQSSRYSATGWILPSVMVRSTVKELVAYQVAASRSEKPGFWSAR